MKSPFNRETIALAREHKLPLIALVHRKLGESTRDDQQLSVSGPAEEDVAAVVHAFALWLSLDSKKDERLARLKELVAKL